MINMLRNMAMFMEMKCRSFLSDESGEVNVVAIVVLIGVAVLLAIIFRDAIGDLLNTLFGTIRDNAEGAIADGAITTSGH